MFDVQSILRSCTVLEFFCELAGEGESVVAELASRFDQLQSQSSRVFCCWTSQRYPEGETSDSSRCVLELRAELLTIAPDAAKRALLELTAPLAVPGTVQIVDRYSNGDA